MIHVETGINSVYLYSADSTLIDFNIKITGKEGRELVDINVPLTIAFFGNSFYQLTFTAPALKNIEYTYDITSEGVTKDKGILRNGNI
jgi:hypothetical protein